MLTESEEERQSEKGSERAIISFRKNSSVNGIIKNYVCSAENLLKCVKINK